VHDKKTCVEWDYKVDDKVIFRKDGILWKTERKYDSDPWTIMSVHTDGTSRMQHGPKSVCLKIRNSIPYFELMKRHNFPTLCKTLTLKSQNIDPFLLPHITSDIIYANTSFCSLLVFCSCYHLMLHSWRQVT
jgi:hypothetical protein